MHVQALSQGSNQHLSTQVTQPASQIRAFDNAKHIIGLSRGVKTRSRRFAGTLSRATHFAPIFPHKAHIASRIGIDERTVYRHMNAIKEHGLIEVMSQERKSRNGRFAVARIRLTKKAAELLGFNRGRKTTISTGQPDDNLSDGHTLTEPTIPKKQPATRKHTAR
jgi:DNA-binding transcriptional ArsR family regulator